MSKPDSPDLNDSPADQAEHDSRTATRLCCAAITISDTRTEADDRGGKLLADLLTEAGHKVAVRRIVPDEPDRIRPLVEQLVADASIDAVLMTGGTGVSARDQTYETVSSLMTKPLPGYGELFRLLSFEEIGPAAMLSRATGGVVQTTVLLTMPGSPAAVRLAMQRLILPELGHLVHEATK